MALGGRELRACYNTWSSNSSVKRLCGLISIGNATARQWDIIALDFEVLCDQTRVSLTQRVMSMLCSGLLCTSLCSLCIPILQYYEIHSFGFKPWDYSHSVPIIELTCSGPSICRAYGVHAVHAAVSHLSCCNVICQVFMLITGTC